MYSVTTLVCRRDDGCMASLLRPGTWRRHPRKGHGPPRRSVWAGPLRGPHDAGAKCRGANRASVDSRCNLFRLL